MMFDREASIEKREPKWNEDMELWRPEKAKTTYM